MTDLIAIYPKEPEACRHRGAVGLYGRLVVAAQPEEPIGFMWRQGYVRLPSGVYEAAFSHLDKGPRCIRVLAPLASFALTQKQEGVLERDSLCIHGAQFPTQLKGCQAPGRHRAPDGWVAGDSTTTMGLLYHLLGGFVLGRKLVLEVHDQ